MRRAYIEMPVFGEGDKSPVGAGGIELLDRPYDEAAPYMAQTAITTFVQNFGYPKDVGRDMADGFAARFADESAQVLDGQAEQSPFYTFDTNDILPSRRDAAGLLIRQVAELSSGEPDDLVWRDGVTAYTVSNGTQLHIGTVKTRMTSVLDGLARS